MGSIIGGRPQGQIGGLTNTANQDISTTLSSVAQGIGSLTSAGIGAAKSRFEHSLLPAVQENNLGAGISALGEIPGPSQFLSFNYSESNPKLGSPPDPVKMALTDPTLNSLGKIKSLLGSLEGITPQNFLSGESLGQFEQFQKTLQSATKQFDDLQTQMITKFRA